MKFNLVVLMVILLMMLAACAPATTMPLVTAVPNPIDTTPPPGSPQAVVPEVATIPACTPGTAIFPPPDAATAAVIAAMPPVTDQDHMRGNPEAKITIMEYSDFM